MPRQFKQVGIISRHQPKRVGDTLLALIECLKARKIPLVIENETVQLLPKKVAHPTLPANQLGWNSDLLVSVGGDGSLLQAAHIAVEQQVPILGINRGSLGFLTDISPDQLSAQINSVLDGHYHKEKRFLLSAKIDDKPAGYGLNEVILMPAELAHMIEFDIFINDVFVCRERSDGIIVATPTGSTAYALSGGGPILHPSLDAMVLVSMFSHTLASRPLVISGNSTIKLAIAKNNRISSWASCDGQQRIMVKPGSYITIQKKQEHLTLLHPLDYNYYKALRTKLNWNTRNKQGQS